MMIVATYLLHPLNGLGYQFFSGIGSSISEWLTIFLAISVYVYHHNCHIHRCLRFGKHTVDGTPYVVCRKHHPDLRGNKIKLHHVNTAHQNYIKQKYNK